MSSSSPKKNMTGQSSAVKSGGQSKSLWVRMLKAREMYLLLIPGILWYVVFAYLPMGGIVLAFKNYKANLGIWGSPWVGLDNYTYLIHDTAFYQALKNTIVISFSRILFQFPVPIILALLINELSSQKFKRVLQTVFTFPNFLSWVIVAGIMFNILETNGIINAIIQMFGGQKIDLLGNQRLFRPLLYITESWKSAGWSCIIYLAAIAGVEQEQYESAMIDGANRFQRVWHITLPCISPTIIVMFILAVGNIMNGGFDQIFNMQNPAVQNVSEILDTYIYRITFQSSTDFSFSTAVGLFKSVINFALLVITDKVAKRVGGSGLFA